MVWNEATNCLSEKSPENYFTNPQGFWYERMGVLVGNPLEVPRSCFVGVAWNFLPPRRGKVKPLSQGWLIAARAYLGFCSPKQLEVFLLPLGGMLVHRKSLPHNFVRFTQQFAGTHLDTWAEKGTVRVKCLAQEYNTMSLARARTWTARSGVERTNHKATVPLTFHDLLSHFFLCIPQEKSLQKLCKMAGYWPYSFSACSDLNSVSP